MIEWRDDILPVSTRFDDPYYSRVDGRAETSHVFIDGNNLPARWPEMKTCTIAELGFGTGLNFLETIRQWQLLRDADARLDFISFEQFPMDTSDISRALSNWPQLQQLAQGLCEVWERDSEVLQVEFMHNIQLTIYFGDANLNLPKQDFKADAWFLDGFAPAKNPELWNDTLMHEVARHTTQGGTFSTYSVAGLVRKNLTEAGFHAEKVKGFANKREMLAGFLE